MSTKGKKSLKPAKAKSANPPEAGAGGEPPVSVTPPPVTGPMFRRVDWMTAGLTALVVFLAYLFTMAPDVGLEDSGELAVGSYYAGVPHPPGYPVWTLYTWLFTVLVPISNIAFRVTLSSAFAGACSCGLLALMVSRGSSMFIESIDELKKIPRKTEDLICMVCGWVAAAVMAFNGFLWSQAVIVEVYTLSLLSFMAVLCLLMRWMYAPQQRKYLYWCFFLFGICFTNHQTLVVAAIGIEVAIAAAKPRLGRDMFFFNSVIFILGLIGKWLGIITTFNGNPPLFAIYLMVGFGSIAACGYLWYQTEEILTEMRTVLLLWFIFFPLGVSFYLYMPLASTTNPPMNWGYPRHFEGFVHALTRGQYEAVNPTTSPFRFVQQLWTYLRGASQEFNAIFLMISLLPFAFFQQLKKRERAWMTGLVGVFFCLAVILMILLNPNPDKQSQDLNRVFFTASHVMIAMWIGYGLSLFTALLLVRYDEWRSFALGGGAVAAAIALWALIGLESAHPLDKFTAWYGLLLSIAFIASFGISRQRVAFQVLLVIFAIMPLHSALSHWWENEKRGHLFGYWFGHDMFKPPYEIYPEMTEDAILFGGTDPGRFNPTYMIFCESFLPPSKKRDPEFDRSDVYLITQNALADNTYLDYIRAHYNRSTQIDPPFFQGAVSYLGGKLKGQEIPVSTNVNFLTKLVAPLDRVMTSIGAGVEKRRRAKGVYPLTEIYCPTGDDSAAAYEEYLMDAARRHRLNQLKPGEQVDVNAQGMLSVQGQVAVMSINALLAKVIFEKNPDRDFFIEESFPLEWMYPHLSPFGIIMKINREPVQAFTEEMLQRDREFWTRYVEKFIGDWITEETTIDEIAEFSERVYLRKDLSGFGGDAKFVRDDWAQKAFSKLRSAIAGIYAWRLSAECPEELRPVTAEDQQRLLREADFAFRQALALCPYSPEAVYRYSNMLATVNRIDDAIKITQTCFKFDLDNAGVQQLLQNLTLMKQNQSMVNELQNEVSRLEDRYQTNRADLDVAFELMSKYVQLARTNDALVMLERIVNDPTSTATALLAAAGAYSQLGQYEELEVALLKLVALVPDNPEAWYDLAGTQALLQKNQEALDHLSKAVGLSRVRQGQDPASQDLVQRAHADPRFNGIRFLPGYREIVTGN